MQEGTKTTGSPPRIRHRQTIAICTFAGAAFGVSSAMPASAVDEQATSLEPMRVISTPDEGYASTSTSTATKTDVPIHATPMTINVVPRTVIDDQQALSLEAILSNVPGVQAHDSDSGFGAKSYFMRGFDTQNRLHVDGVQSLLFDRIDPALIERVEVLKGSAASLYGRIEPGGMINVVTKSPQALRSISAEQSSGSYRLWRSELDATGALDDGKTLLGRGIVAYQSEGSYRDTVHSKHLTLAPALTWTPEQHDQLDLKLQYRDFKDATDYGIPMVPTSIDANGTTLTSRIPDVPRHVYFSAADNIVHEMETTASLSWTHSIDDRWTIKPKFEWSHLYQPGTEGGFSGWDNQPADGWGAATPTVASIYAANPSNFHQDRKHSEIDVIGKLSWGPTRHEILASVEYFDWHYLYEFWQTTNQPNPIDWTQPVYQPISLFRDNPDSRPPDVSNQRQDRWWSYTVQDQMQPIERLRLLIGVRYDHSTSSSRGVSNGTAYGLDHVGDSIYQPRLGISYDVTPWLAAYASYAEAYGANDYSVLYDGSASKSQTSRQQEIGAKGHWFDDALIGSVALFDLVKRNVVVDVPASQLGGACRVPDPFLPVDCLAQAARSGSRGLEVELEGRLGPRWSLRFAYAHTSAKVLEGGDAGTPGASSLPVGKRLPGVPLDAGSTWLHYRHPAGWALGIGAIAQGRRPVDQNNTAFLPAFVRYDAGASYEWKANKTRWRAQLKLANLGNAREYQISYGPGVIPPPPRTIYAAISAVFD